MFICNSFVLSFIIKFLFISICVYILINIVTRPGRQDVTDYSLTAMLGVVTWAAGRSGRSAWSWWRRSGTCSAGSCRHRCAAQSG